MRRKAVAGGTLLVLSGVSRFGRAMLGVIGLAGVADDAPTWIRVLEDPWVYGSLFLAGLVMLALALRDRHAANTGSSGGGVVQTARSGGNTLQAGRDFVTVGSVFVGQPETRAAEDARIKAVDAVDRAAKAITPDGIDRAAGDFRTALAEIERHADDASVALLIQELRRGASPPFQFSRPDFREKLEQLIESTRVKVKVEITFEFTECSHAGLLAAYDREGKRVGTTLTVGLDGVKITNHDSAATVIDSIWLELDGRIKVTLPISGNNQIPGRDTRVFNGLEADHFLEEIVSQAEGASRLRICVKAIGLGTFCHKLPKRLFELEGNGGGVE